MLIEFETMADEMSALVFTSRPDGEVDYVNRRCLEYLGVAEASVVAKRWTEWIHPDDLGGVLAERDESVSTGATYDRRQRLRRHDGVYRWHSVSVRPVLDADDSIAVWVGVAVDVHERELAERAVARSEERFRLLAAVTAEVVFDWDVVADRIWVSNDLSGLVGAPAIDTDQGVGIESVLRFVHPDDAERIRADVRTLGAVGEPVASWSTAFRIVRADRVTIEVVARTAVVRDDTGRVVRLIGSLEDRSAKQQIARQLARAQHLDTFAQLAAGLAHELNNILAVVIGSTDELMEGLEDRPALREFASLSHDAAQRGANLVADLQSFARQQQLSAETVDLPELLDAVARTSRRALSRSISIDVACDDDVGPIVADRGRLESAVFSACLNAADAMPDGGRITVSATDTMVLGTDPAGPADPADPADSGGPMRPGRYVVIDVVDTGVGMSPEVLERSTEPFSPRRTAPNTPGWG